jgi:hypothetical protein
MTTEAITPAASAYDRRHELAQALCAHSARPHLQLQAIGRVSQALTQDRDMRGPPPVAHPTTCRSILAFLAPSRSAQTRRHASPCAIAPPLAARSHSRGTLAAQIPIAEPAARPTERTSRDFVPWRFSDAGRRSAWLDRRFRRPKTCTKPAQKKPAVSKCSNCTIEPGLTQ